MVEGEERRKSCTVGGEAPNVETGEENDTKKEKK